MSDRVANFNQWGDVHRACIRFLTCDSSSVSEDIAFDVVSKGHGAETWLYKSRTIIIPLYPAKLNPNGPDKKERRPERQQAVGMHGRTHEIS